MEKRLQSCVLSICPSLSISWYRVSLVYMTFFDKTDITFTFSSWYYRAGWLGVKHPLTYLLKVTYLHSHHFPHQPLPMTDAAAVPIQWPPDPAAIRCHYRYSQTTTAFPSSETLLVRAAWQSEISNIKTCLMVRPAGSTCIPDLMLYNTGAYGVRTRHKCNTVF